MAHYLCTTCGTQYGEGDSPPPSCAVCAYERQYLGWDGRRWTTLAEMSAEGYRNEVRHLEPGLIGIGIEPPFAVGQRALLVRAQAGNVLWDPVSFMDERVVDQIYTFGGIEAISGGLGGAHVGTHRDVHADEAARTRQHRAEHEAHRGGAVAEFPVVCDDRPIRIDRRRRIEAYGLPGERR